MEGGVFPEMEVDHGALFHGQNQESGGEGIIEQGGVRIGRRSEERLGFRVPPGFPRGAGFLLAEAVEDQPMGQFKQAGSGGKGRGDWSPGYPCENGMQDILRVRPIMEQMQREGIDGCGVLVIKSGKISHGDERGTRNDGAVGFLCHPFFRLFSISWFQGSPRAPRVVFGAPPKARGGGVGQAGSEEGIVFAAAAAVAASIEYANGVPPSSPGLRAPRYPGNPSPRQPTPPGLRSGRGPAEPSCGSS